MPEGLASESRVAGFGCRRSRFGDLRSNREIGRIFGTNALKPHLFKRPRNIVVKRQVQHNHRVDEEQKVDGLLF